MIIDGHTHIFPPAVIANVAAKEDLVRALHLQTDRAAARTSPQALRQEAGEAGITACVLLPTAARDSVAKVNRIFRELCASQRCASPRLYTLGTLHPEHPEISAELERFEAADIRGIKLCSFSQGFDLRAEGTRQMFTVIEKHNQASDRPFFVILDTFRQADRFFGAPEEHLTTPERLGELVRAFPEIDFVGAHMAGLAAPLDEVLEHLPPRDNFYLETSNAAHTLEREQFVRLLQLHGPERIVFGTDWPWFGQKDELRLIRELTGAAGFDDAERQAVFGGNAARLLGISAEDASGTAVP